MPHPSCKRAARALARARKSGAPPGIRTRSSVFLTHARMPIPPAGRSGRGTRGSAATGKPAREGNKKPGDLAAHPGSDGLPAITGSLEGLLRSVRARIRVAWRDGLSLLLESQMSVHRNSIHIRSPNAVLATALTLPETKSPERSRGPGFGWALSAYAIFVSRSASL